MLARGPAARGPEPSALHAAAQLGLPRRRSGRWTGRPRSGPRSASRTTSAVVLYTGNLGRKQGVGLIAEAAALAERDGGSPHAVRRRRRTAPTARRWRRPPPSTGLANLLRCCRCSRTRLQRAPQPGGRPPHRPGRRRRRPRDAVQAHQHARQRPARRRDGRRPDRPCLPGARQRPRRRGRRRAMRPPWPRRSTRCWPTTRPRAAGREGAGLRAAAPGQGQAPGAAAGAVGRPDERRVGEGHAAVKVGAGRPMKECHTLQKKYDGARS